MHVDFEANVWMFMVKTKNHGKCKKKKKEYLFEKDKLPNLSLQFLPLG